MFLFFLLEFAYQKVPILSGSELKHFLQNSHRAVVFFLSGVLHVEQNGYDILEFKNQIDIIESTKEEGLKYNCSAFPCIIPFADGVSLKGIDTELPSSFSDWLRYIISIDTIQINSTEQARTLLEGNGSYIIAVDYYSRPVNAPSGSTIYLIPSIYLQGAISKGIYNFDTSLNSFTPIAYEKPDIYEPENINLNMQLLAGYMVHKYASNDGNRQSILTELSRKLSRNITFTMLSGPASKLFKRNGRLELYKPPYFFIFDLKEQGKKRWIIRGADMNNVSYLHSYIKKVRQGKIPPTVISEPDPNESPIVLYRHLVASNFKRYVMDDNSKDAVVLFITPWAKRCPKFQFVFRRVATLLKNTKVRVFWFDASQNDIPDFVPDFCGFPSVFMWPAGMKDRKPALYNGKGKISDALKFIHEHASEKFVVPDSEHIETRLKDENL